MNKPISMIINETRISLANVCNESKLPPCVLEPIIRDLHEEITQFCAIQLKQDEENYAKALEETKKEQSKKE